MTDNSAGTIEIGAGVDKTCLIAQMLQAFPQASFALPIESRAQIGQLRNRLTQLGIMLNEQIANCCGELVTRVNIGTYTDMADCDESFEKRDIVIALDCLQALGQRAQLALLTTDARFRLYGIAQHPHRPSRYERACLLATFGPAAIYVPKHGFEELPVNVAWSRIDAPAVSPHLQGRDLMAAGYWRHPTRNRRIAKVARAIANGEIEQVQQLLTPSTQHYFCRPIRRVAVVTECLTHAIDLARSLPGWSIVCGEDAELTGFDRNDRGLLVSRSPGWNTAERFIATRDGMSKIDPLTLDVVVWAGGGAAIPLYPNQLVCPAGSDQRLLIIDFADRHSPALRASFHFRRALYNAAHWFRPGISRTDGRITMALADFIGAQE